MAEEKKLFLKLPAELRNMIYRMVTATHKISLSGSTTQVFLLGGPHPTFARLNREVQGQYLAEIAPHATVSVDLGPLDLGNVANMELKDERDYPSACLQKARKIELNAFWTHGACMPKSRSHWWRCDICSPWSLDDLKRVERLELQWTPSKALRSFLIGLFADLRPESNLNAFVKVTINMTEYPQTGKNAMVYHHPTVAKLLEGTLDWPATDHLQIEYIMGVPLFERRIPDHGRPHWTQGLAQWRLTPVGDAVGLEKYDAEFIQVLYDGQL